MNSHSSYGSFQPLSRVRSASPKSRESELYTDSFGGSGRQSHLGQSPKNRCGPLFGAKSTPSLLGSGGRSPQPAWRSQSVKRSSSYAGQRSSPQSPQSTSQHRAQLTTNYNRPWLQKNLRPDGTAVEKSDAKRTKETATWWNREADRMAHAISKLKTQRDELKEELAQTEKSARQCNYELGLARAAHDRQKEQAEAAMNRRTKLEQEVVRLKQEKKESKYEAQTKKDEVERLRDKAQDLEAQVAEVKRQQAEKAEKMARRAAAEERKRLAASPDPDAIRSAADPIHAIQASAPELARRASAGALARRDSARASAQAPKAVPKSPAKQKPNSPAKQVPKSPAKHGSISPPAKRGTISHLGLSSA